jgi:hypothetical protein
MAGTLSVVRTANLQPLRSILKFILNGFFIRRTVSVPGAALGASTDGITHSCPSSRSWASAMFARSEVRPHFTQNHSWVPEFHLISACIIARWPDWPWILRAPGEKAWVWHFQFSKEQSTLSPHRQSLAHLAKLQADFGGPEEDCVGFGQKRLVCPTPVRQLQRPQKIASNSH